MPLNTFRKSHFFVPLQSIFNIFGELNRYISDLSPFQTRFLIRHTNIFEKQNRFTTGIAKLYHLLLKKTKRLRKKIKAVLKSPGQGLSNARRIRI